MANCSVTILGSLPDDLLAAAAHDTVRSTLSGLQWSLDGRTVQLAAAAAIIFVDTQSGHSWRAALRRTDIALAEHGTESELEGQHDGSGVGGDVVPVNPHAPCVVIDGESWQRHTVPVKRDPSKQAADAASAQKVGPVVTTTPPAHRDTAAVVEPCLVGCTLEELVRSSAHRRLLDEVVLFLAPARRTEAEVMAHVFTTSTHATELRSRYAAADVRHVVSLLTRTVSTGIGGSGDATGRAAWLELGPAGFALVELDRFDSKRSKQLIAHRAFASLAQAGNTDVALRDRLLQSMELYVDRDVVLAVRSGGGGIMAGLGSLKRVAREVAREDDNDDAVDDYAHADVIRDGAPRARSRIVDMTQCDITWTEGDLSSIAEGTFVCDTYDTLHTLQKWYEARAVVVTPDAMPITTAAALHEAQTLYGQLLPRLGELRAGLERHAEVLRQARAWCDTHLRERGTVTLRNQLQQWMSRQRTHRLALTELYSRLHHALYTLERDITDYSDLRALGVVCEESAVEPNVS